MGRFVRIFLICMDSWMGLSGWWFQICVTFTRFDPSANLSNLTWTYFADGLVQPPTSYPFSLSQRILEMCFSRIHLHPQGIMNSILVFHQLTRWLQTKRRYDSQHLCCWSLKRHLFWFGNFFGIQIVMFWHAKVGQTRGYPVIVVAVFQIVSYCYLMIKVSLVSWLMTVSLVA